jgi:transposase
MGWSAALARQQWGYNGEDRRHPMELHTIGIDLGKTVFHLVGLNLRGEVVVRKKCSRKQLLQFTANLKVELIGMEACGGSHFLGRALREQGHEVRLIPAQYVKPYIKTNKSDYIDALREAFVPGCRCRRQRKLPTGLCGAYLSRPSVAFRGGMGC